MVLQIAAGSRIENPRGYSTATVEDLQNLLARGAQAQPDSARDRFYELEGTEDVYYIHISPITENVVLLARWVRHGKDRALEPQAMVV